MTGQGRASQAAESRTHAPYALWAVGVVIGSLALLLVIQSVPWFSRNASSDGKATNPAPVATVSQTSVGAPSPAPLAPKPVVAPAPVVDAAVKARHAEQQRRDVLVQASLRGNPKEVLVAAKPLLDLQPQDAAARAAVRGVLEKELRRVLETPLPTEGATRPDESPWQVWSDLGVPEARLLHASHLLATSPESAAAMVKNLADDGNAPALTFLGQLHAAGLGVAQSDASAALAFENAAGMGDRTGRGLWGEALLSGKGAARNPNAGIQWIRQAAESGDARAMNVLGNCLLKGNGVRPDHTAAAGWFRKAADAGNLNGTANLAVLLINGDGVREDFGQALALVRRGSERGHAYSTHLLAFCHEKGFGVTRDLAGATRLYQRAAGLGHGPAKDWCERHDVPFSPIPQGSSVAGSLPPDRVE